jgi:ankyrin repeat protein
VYDIDDSRVRDEGYRSSTPIFSPFYAAASLGIRQAVCKLVEQGADVNAIQPTQHKKQSKALQMASLRGHTEIVRWLLEHGAEMNTEGGRFYNGALQAASSRGHIDVVHLLLDNGADVNMQGGHYGNALESASARGRVEIVRMLLDFMAHCVTLEQYAHAGVRVSEIL